MAQDISNVEPEAFACALHFFLGLLQKQVSRNVSKSTSSVDLRSLSTPTPISAFIRSVLDPMASSGSLASLSATQKSSSGSVPITMALSRLMTKVRRVQYADSNGSKKLSRISLFPQKFNDYRLPLLPLSALSFCLQNQDPSDRIGALRMLLGLTALHPLHADQIGSTEQILNSLLLSLKKVLFSEDRNVSYSQSYSTQAQELQFVHGGSEAEDACTLRLLSALSFRSISTRKEIGRSLTLHSVIQCILQRICSSSKSESRSSENFSLPQMVSFWSISSPLKTLEDPVDRFNLSELTVALLDLACSLCPNTDYCENESTTSSLIALDKVVQSCFNTLVENFRSPLGSGATTQILDLRKCVIAMESLSILKSYLTDGVCESQSKDNDMTVLFFKTERYEEDSAEMMSLVWRGLLLRTPPRQSDITDCSPINVFEDIYPLFRDLSAAIKFPLELKNDHDLKSEHGRNNKTGTLDSKFKNVPHLNIAKGGNVLNLIAELGQGDLTPRLSSHLESLIGLGSYILNDWSVSWPTLPALVISTKIAYMLQVARSSGGSVKSFLGFILNGAERDDGSPNRAAGKDSGNLLVAQRLSHSLAAILTGGRVTIYVPIKVLRSNESEEERSFHGDEENLSNSSCSSDNFDAGFVTSDYDSQDSRLWSRHGVKTGDLSPRTSGWGASNIIPRSSGSTPRSRGNTDAGRGGRPSSAKMHRRTLYATKIVEQTYTAEVLRCNRALQSVTYLLTDVMSEISRMTIEARTAPPVEAVTDRVFDYTVVTRFLLSVLSGTPRAEEEGSGLVMCLASLECLISLSLCNVNKIDSSLPGASAHYSNSNNKASTSPVHSAIIANIHLIASQLERLGMRVLGPSLRLLIAVSSSLKLTVLKEETCCAALVRLVIAGLKSHLRSENADSAAAESCGLIVAMGRSHPDTVIAILSRNEVEDSLLDLIQDLVKKRSIVVIAPSAGQRDLHNRDLYCLSCALEAMVVLTDCFNPSPYFIYDPSWSHLSSDRRLINRLKEDGPAGDGYGKLRACAFTGAQAVVQVLNGQPAVRKLEGLSTETTMLLLYCYNAASSLLQLEIRIKAEESCEHITSLREDLIPVLLPLLPLALEPAFHPVFKPQKPSDSMNSINLQPTLYLRAEEGASLLVGSAMHFISALLQCDKVILSNFKAQDLCDQHYSRKPLSLYELFSALEIPSWAVGKPFRHLFSQRVPTFEEWSGVTRATTSSHSSSGHSSSGHSLVVSGTGTPCPVKHEDKLVRDFQRAGSLLQLVLHLMDAPTAAEREDLYGSTDSFRQLNVNIGWARDNEFVQLRGMELLSSLALGGVDFCESAILPRQDSQTLNVVALTFALRSNSISDSDGELTPRRRSTLKAGPHGFKRTFPIMGSEKSQGVTPIPRALSALCLALTAGSSSTQSSRHKEVAGPLSLTARGARLRRAFVIALKAIVQTSEGVGCDVIVQSEAHKWLYLFLRAEAEVAPKPPPKTRRSSGGGHAAAELFRSLGQEDCTSALGYGEEPLHSPSCTPALCCQVVALLASAGFSNSLCLSGMCEAVLSLMVAHSHIPRIQLEGLSALVEMLTGAPEHLPRLNAHTGASTSIFEEEPLNRNPFASKSPSAPPSARAVAQHAADTISDALDSLEDTVTDTTLTDATVEDRKKYLRLLLSRHKKLGLDQESCSIS